MAELTGLVIFRAGRRRAQCGCLSRSASKGFNRCVAVYRSLCAQPSFMDIKRELHARALVGLSTSLALLFTARMLAFPPPSVHTLPLPPSPTRCLRTTWVDHNPWAGDKLWPRSACTPSLAHPSCSPAWRRCAHTSAAHMLWSCSCQIETSCCFRMTAKASNTTNWVDKVGWGPTGRRVASGLHRGTGEGMGWE